MITRGFDGFFHPTTVDEIAELVNYAREAQLPLRVCGSSHSEIAAIHSDSFAQGESHKSVEILLDRMTNIELDQETSRVTVGAGCKFGFDPGDTTGQSIEGSGLCWFLDNHGLAISLLGGVSHQTVAGFLATGSEGGSLRYSVYDHVFAVTLVDGTGTIRRFEKGQADFPAALVSLGCLGVVTSVEFQCVPRYNVVGKEKVVTVQDADFDLYAEGEQGVAGFFARHDYTRILWWPQPGVDKMVLWWGDQTLESKPRQQYNPFPPVAGSQLPLQGLAGLTLRLIGHRPANLPQRLRPLAERGLAKIYNAFMPEGPEQDLHDTWHRAIPVDDYIEEAFMPVRFTELWADLDDAPELLSRIKNVFAEGYAGSGNFLVEVYCSKENPAFMSPGYGRRSIRMNFLWLTSNPGEPQAFFRKYWEACEGLEVRQHWGKILDRKTRSVLPKQAEYLALRQRLDPEDLFLSSYWRQQLGLADIEVKAPQVKFRSEDLKRPLFGLTPATPDFVTQATDAFDLSFETTANPDETYDVVAAISPPGAWLGALLRGYEIRRDEPGGVGTVVDEHFLGFTVRVRTIIDKPGERWASSIDACSLPLAQQMLQDIKLEPSGRRTRVSWKIHYTPMDATAFMVPVMRPLFRTFFSRVSYQAKRYLDAQARR